MSGSWLAFQLTEFFHLSLLEVMQVRLDQNYYVLKGGANLRYFYSSPRYSEDMDFDAADIDPSSLETKVDGALASRPLALILRTLGLTLNMVTKPKQTRTTQRWKLALAVAGLSEPIRTKIEFSHRAADQRSQLDQVPSEITARYALRAPTVRRYLPAAAIEQKVSALADRAETQARDVFDLDLLFRRWPDVIQPGTIGKDRLDVAAERASQLPLESYKSLVIRFLDPEIVELYDRPEVWNQMQTYVVERLMTLR